MSHEIEFVGGVAQMAYAGEVPWHGYGKRVPPDLTPEQMLEAAGLNWTVEPTPAFATIGGKKTKIGRNALVRSSDNKILDVVPSSWASLQNQEAFEFFNDFVAEGDMEMHTAGSLKGGQIVWALAKVNNSFELFGGDRVDSYLHFTNFHKFGYATDVRFTPIRVVCNNTLTLSLSTQVDRMVKVSHRKEFDPENVKVMLGVAAQRLQKYKETAAFLGSKRFANDNLVEYFKGLFPVYGKGVKKDLSKSASLALDLVDSQPGAEFAPGTWWSAFNCVTYMTDHVIGKSVDTRMTSSWYGLNKGLKVRALEEAMEYAAAA